MNMIIFIFPYDTIILWWYLVFISLSPVDWSIKKISSSIWIRFLHSSVPPFLLRLLTFFSIFLLPLGMPISPEIIDGFWCSRCLNDYIDLLYMIGSFTSGANISLVAKNGTKQIISLLAIKSSPVEKEASNKKVS